RLDLHMADARTAARTPRHHVVTAVQPPALVARLDHAPDRVVVLVRHREVRVAPVHPLAKSNALLADDSRELQNAVFAALVELRNTVLFDVTFTGKSEFFLNFNFDPQALTIEAVLPALIKAIHG